MCLLFFFSEYVVVVGDDMLDIGMFEYVVIKIVVNDVYLMVKV